MAGNSEGTCMKREAQKNLVFGELCGCVGSKVQLSIYKESRWGKLGVPDLPLGEFSCILSLSLKCRCS